VARNCALAEVPHPLFHLELMLMTPQKIGDPQQVPALIFAKKMT
jgi:hypothetical protein